MTTPPMTPTPRAPLSQQRAARRPARRHTGGAGAIALATLLAFGLTACGSGSPAGGSGEAASDSAGSETASGDLTPITVGAIPIGDVAPIHVGVQEGFFEDEGLDVDVVNTSGGAIAVPGVVAGDYDFAFGNTVSLMVARDQGLPLTYVANGTTTTGEEGADFAAVVALEDSELDSTADLQGHTSSSNNLLNIGDTSIRQAVDNAGGDGAEMDFIELAFGDAAAAVQNGQVEAALVLEPYLTQSLDAGLKAVSWPYAEAHPELDIGGYFTSEDTLDQRPEDVEAFTRAMRRSMEFSQENPEVVREVIGEYTEIDPEVLERITLPRFKTDFSREAIAALGDSAVKYGVIDDAPNLDALLPEETP
ncbi:ABC transporter substrate-binding protein [Citricoccus nitrophenolicus]|uniref:ABC transporter substrate-binding protein n=1 Tax=Citricoccus nitrophenolicus TaxID=863575 RepID=UPI0039B458ED